MEQARTVFGGRFWLGLLLTFACGSLIRGQDPFPEGTVGELYYCPRIDLNPQKDGGPLKITLDGVLDEAAWQRAAFHSYTEYWKGGAPVTDPADCDPTWAAVADDQFLYVAWRVVDESRQQQSTACQAWNDDAVEIYFDGLGDGCNPGCDFTIDDFQLVVGTETMGQTDPGALTAGMLRNGGCVGGPFPELFQGVVAELSTDEGLPGWQGEIAIALHNLNGDWDIDPSHGTAIGWDLHTDDDDTGGGQTAGVTSALIWSRKDGGSQAWHNTGVFGKLQFFDPRKALVQISRDIPDTLHNGGSTTVSLKVTPSFGAGVVVIDESLPPTLVPEEPSHGGIILGNTIRWDLGVVDQPTVLTYTMSVDPEAGDVEIPAAATLDGDPTPITGDLAYTGSPITTRGFIKAWNHLGPLAFTFPAKANDHGDPTMGITGSCDANGGADLALDWISSESEGVSEAGINPFPGLITRPEYGGNGAGNGARAAGLVVEGGDTGKVVQDQFPAWKGSLSPDDTIVHDSELVNGINAEDHVTLSSVYVTNKTGKAIATQLGLASDDSIQVAVGNQVFLPISICRGYGGPNEEQDFIPLTLPAGESRVLVKVSDGYGASGFRLRFQDLGDPNGGGLVPPTISVGLESKVHPRPGKVVRSFSGESYRLGEEVDVSLTLTAPAAADMVLREVLPAGLSASLITEGGQPAGGAIQWNLSQVTDTTVSYRLVPGACAGDLVFSQSTLKIGQVEMLVAGSTALPRRYQDDALSGWDSQDVVATGGSVQTLGPHDISVKGTGGGLKGSKDEFRFVSLLGGENFEVSARIDCFQTSGAKGLAGLMARDTLDPFAANIFFGVGPAVPGGPATLKGSLRRQTNTVGITVQLSFADPSVTLPVYLKLKRDGTKLTLERAPVLGDGSAGQYAILLTKTVGTDVNLKSEARFGLIVTAGDTSGNGITLTEFSRVSGPAFREPPPDPPANLIATGGVEQISLSWTAPAAPPAPASYAIHRGPRGGPYTKVNEVPAAETSYTDKGLPDGTEFCYVLRSVGPTGSSEPSGEACARTRTGGTPFKRGDADADGEINLTDPIFILANQFQGGPAPLCMDSADVDDQGDYNLTDAIFSLSWQFLAGAEPPKPGPFQCGLEDTTGDAFTECVYTHCPP